MEKHDNSIDFEPVSIEEASKTPSPALNLTREQQDAKYRAVETSSVDSESLQKIKERMGNQNRIPLEDSSLPSARNSSEGKIQPNFLERETIRLEIFNIRIERAIKNFFKIVFGV